MKADTTILLVKGACYVLIGATTPFGVALAQWANSGQWPPRIIWVIIIMASIGGAASQLLSFLSGSYSDYIKGRSNGLAKSDDTTQFLLSKTKKAELDKTNELKP